MYFLLNMLYCSALLVKTQIIIPITGAKVVVNIFSYVKRQHRVFRENIISYESVPEIEMIGPHKLLTRSFPIFLRGVMVDDYI